MMSPTAPLVLPGSESECCRSARDSCEFTRRHGVLMVATLEMLACLSGAVLYVYALAAEPKWASHLVPIPPGLCSSVDIVDAIMYIFILLFTMELFLAMHLFEGARRENLDGVRFWLCAMLTYLSLVSIIIIGLELGGIRSPTVNSIAFINIFFRFIEIMIVYSWTEQEAMRKLAGMRRRCASMTSTCHGLGSAVSTATVNTVVVADTSATPPPSYEATLPPINSPFTFSQATQETTPASAESVTVTIADISPVTTTTTTTNTTTETKDEEQ